MKRYLPSSRSRSNTRNTSALGEELIREFTQQAQQIMADLSAQFADSLQAQAASILQAQFTPNAGGGYNFSDVPTASGASSADSIGAIGQLLGTTARYLVSRPRTSKREVETARSIQAAQLSVSSSQAAAEAQQALNKGSKNL